MPYTMLDTGYHGEQDKSVIYWEEIDKEALSLQYDKWDSQGIWYSAMKARKRVS